ncbi:hypothetical protein GGF46_004384 [Coemansia sp. RSA 552]|nr:hypothetical protein GGF46_004384 [Coemansia sp. RSA 552]
MDDPFASIRRKPVAAKATYGRKALVARRLAQTTGSLATSLPPLPAKAAVSSDESSSDSSDASLKRTRYSKPADPRSRNTAPFARLGMAHSEAKAPATAKSASPRSVFDATKHSWDLGPQVLEPKAKRKTAQGAGRIAKNATAILASADGPLTRTGTSHRPKPAPKASQTMPAANAAIKARQNHQRTDTASQVTVKAAGGISKPRPARKRRARGTTDGTVRPSSALPVDKDAQRTDAWDMGDLLSSSPMFSAVAKSKRKTSAQRRSKRSKDLPSSSPPSTPGRLANSNRSSQLLTSSLAGSDDDDDGRSGGIDRSVFEPATPLTQQAAGSERGPSVATSKRLQTRAFNQNVVYTYGRPRDEPEDELMLGFSQALGIHAPSGARPQPLLESAGLSGSPDGYSSPVRARTGRSTALAAGHLLERLDDLAGESGAGSRSASTEPFRQQLGAILEGFSPGVGDAESRADSACVLLLERLSDEEFCEELLRSKQGLPTLLLGMHRARAARLAPPTTMLLIALAFSRPALIQVLVFERQALEIVARILKSAVASDILAQRHRSHFDTAAQHRGVAYICQLVREWELMGDMLSVSTYNLALAALHVFTRRDDAVFLAMASLLRNEMHESGCLGLVVERVLVWSIPTLIEQGTRMFQAQLATGSDRGHDALAFGPDMAGQGDSDLLVNLANGSTLFCTRFVSCDGFDVVAKNVAVVSQKLSAKARAPAGSSTDFSPTRGSLADEIGDLRYDVLLVTSALLTNIVDADPSSIVHIGRVSQNRLCRLDKRCYPRCACPSRAPLAVLLAKAFVSCHSATGSADADVAAGYLSVLLGFLMRDPLSPCYKDIREQLPGRDVATIIANIEKFRHISDTVARRFAGLLGGTGQAGRYEHDDNPLLALPGSSQTLGSAGALSTLKPRGSHGPPTEMTKTLLALIAELQAS